MLSMEKTFSNYGISEKNYLTNPEVAEMFWNLKFGIVKFLLGTASLWLLGFLLFFAAKRKAIGNK
jgi:hypothetical protein